MRSGATKAGGSILPVWCSEEKETAKLKIFLDCREREFSIHDRHHE